MSNQPTGAHALLAALQRNGVDTIFGYPGGSMLPIYDALLQFGITHVLARHEQGAGHMAEGYARATGHFGVAFATSGPGATNLVTALADAYLDSVPVVAVTGQVATAGLGREAFQEADVISITAPVTKYSEAVLDVEEIPAAVDRAVRAATSGRPGPVLLDLPKDVLSAPMRRPGAGHEPVTATATATASAGAPAVMPDPDPELLRQAADLMVAAERPVLYVGGGVGNARAADELRELVDLVEMPVVTTLMARGQLPDDHGCHLGMPGMHGRWTATTAMQHADLLVALGARFDDRVTGRPDGFAPHASVVQIDIDEVEIGKNRAVDVPIVADARAGIAALTDVLRDREQPARERWWAQLRRWQAEHPLRVDQDPEGPIKPQAVLQEIDRVRPADSMVIAGVGQHQMWAAQHLSIRRPGEFLTSGGLGTMGFCLPAAIGAKAGRPATTVVAVDGDGSFQMTQQELATAGEAGLPVVVFVLNNAGLGMVRQWQGLFYDGRTSQIDLNPQRPDLLYLARSYGWLGLRCDHPDELSSVVEKAFSAGETPVLVDVRIDPDEMVFPMVPAGRSNDDVVESVAELRRLP